MTKKLQRSLDEARETLIEDLVRRMKEAEEAILQGFQMFHNFADPKQTCVRCGGVFDPANTTARFIPRVEGLPADLEGWWCPACEHRAPKLVTVSHPNPMKTVVHLKP